MKKKYIPLLIGLLLITGCENKEETLKNEYIAMKNETLNEKNYRNEELPVDIVTTIERIDKESINYKVVIKNPKENMYDIKAMVVHNSYNEDVFPAIGVFDQTQDLLISPEEENELILKDTIKTTKNISKLDLILKVWIEYTDENGERKDIYYKTT